MKMSPLTRRLSVILVASMAHSASAQPPSASVPPAQARATPDTRSVRDVLLTVARHQLRDLTDGEYRRGTWEEAQLSRPPKGITWTYQWGVTLYGLLRASEATGDKTFSDFVLKHNQIASRYFTHLKWLERTFESSRKDDLDKALQASGMARFIRLVRLDFCGAMGHAMLEGFLRHNASPTADETAVLDYISDHISKKQPRIEGEGVLFRPEMGNTLWIDDLYMSCPFLIRRTQQTGNPAFLDDAAKQILGMARRQQDTDGLWFHAAHVAKNERAHFKWGRANGWAMVTMVEVLSAMPENHKDRAAILEVLRKMVAGVKALQRPNGMWGQVPTEADMWDETSSTAMFAYSIARGVRRGYLPKEDLQVATKAFAAVMRHVAPNGDILEVSEGTGIGENLDYYRNRRRPVNDHHGPGIVMIAAAELLEVEKEGGASGKAKK